MRLYTKPSEVTLFGEMAICEKKKKGHHHHYHRVQYIIFSFKFYLN